MNKFIRKVRRLARKYNKHIVFPEGSEERILKASEYILRKKIARLTLVGDPRKIKRNADKLGVFIDWDQVNIQNPKTSRLRKKYITEFAKLRAHKGVTPKKAEKILQDINYFGTMMVHMGDADGMVTGTTFPTDDSIRPALQIIKTKDKFHKVSGVFFMVMEKRLLLFADTAITPEPNSHDLAAIAIDTAETAKKFGLEPKIAMLSFSTKGSADHPVVDKMREATAIVRHKRKDLLVDGDLQVDAALVPAVAERKCPDSPVKGQANILIFPNLEAGNIAYKLVERLGKAKAIGPLLQGLKKPVNDLSRGCTYKDIINVTAFTACECET